MRLDKYLKVSRIIKRRTVAKEQVERGHVLLNGKTAKASTDVKIGDTLTILNQQFIIKNLFDFATEEKAKEMYEKR